MHISVSERDRPRYKNEMPDKSQQKVYHLELLFEYMLSTGCSPVRRDFDLLQPQLS